MTVNYSKDHNSEENWNINGKYSETGESEFSRDSTIPYDEDESLLERPFQGIGPRNYQRSDDKIWDDVCETLYRNRDIDAREIEVYVTEGNVQLTGTVESPEQKLLAEYLIEGLTGVKNVRNEVRLRSR